MPARRSASEREEWDVYALAAAPLAGRLRVGGTPLHVHAVGHVAALLGSPRNAPSRLEDALRRQHDIVLGLASRIDPLLPVRFGTRMTIARLVEAVRSSGDQLAGALAHVRGRRQMTLRIIGPPGESQAAGFPPTGGEYLMRQRAKRAIPPEATPLMAAVAAFVLDERLQPGRAAVRTTVFHLVERRAAAAYRRAAARAIPGLDPWSATVSGPWPAFAFAPDLAG